MPKVKLNGKEYELSYILDHDFYQVEIIGGDKVIHPNGYFWNDPDHHNLYNHTEYCWCFLTIKKDGHLTEDDITYKSAECNQYDDENLPEDKVIKMVDEYFNGEIIIPLPIEDVNQDTPCGYYINIKP